MLKRLGSFIGGCYNLFLGLITVFKHLFKRAVTLEYPEKRRDFGKNFRGKPVVAGCIVCGNCIKVCPAGAIRIKGDEFRIDMGKCIFCGNCSFYCPKGAIKMSGEYELASENKKDLTLVYHIDRKPAPAKVEEGGE